MHLYSKQADVILLCYNLTKKKTFDDLDEWLDQLNLDKKAKTLPIALIATKSDLAMDQRAVDTNHGYRKMK